jgi:integrase
LKYKNDFLKIFKDELMKKIPNKNTRKNYIYEIEKAFKNQEFSNIHEFDYEKLKEYTINIENKRSASTLKCSLDLFSKTFNDFDFDRYKSFFEDQVSKKSSRRTTKWDKLELKKVMKKVNFISDDKKRLAYRAIMVTGLRVEELSNVKKKDITIKDGKLFVFVEMGKFGKPRTVEAIDDKYLKNELIKYLDCYGDDEKLFYSAGHMMNFATKKGFQCHDLRRVFSKVLFKEQMEQRGIKSREEIKNEAIDEVKKRLGHEKKSTTYKKYFSRKIDFKNTKWG